ncbi:hypothetical protein [Paragemmobacter ruber]|nr:hypothetical protein [Rhodobacter ruber]
MPKMVGMTAAPACAAAFWQREKRGFQREKWPSQISTIGRVAVWACSFSIFGGQLPIWLREGQMLLASRIPPRWAGFLRESISKVPLTVGYCRIDANNL